MANLVAAVEFWMKLDRALSQNGGMVALFLERIRAVMEATRQLEIVRRVKPPDAVLRYHRGASDALDGYKSFSHSTDDEAIMYTWVHFVDEAVAEAYAASGWAVAILTAEEQLDSARDDFCHLMVENNFRGDGLVLSLLDSLRLAFATAGRDIDDLVPWMR
ncbi:MAG: hypothetical protein WC518_01825 [Patescibacteria group bacterium]